MPTIGLDVGRNRFRAIEIEKDKGIQVLRNFGSYDGPELNLNFSDEDKVIQYAHAIRDFVRDHKFKTPEAVVALPEQDVFVRTIRVPEMDPKELRSFIKLGAEEYIPIPLKDVTYDVQIIGTRDELEVSSDKDEKGNKLMNALLVASRNEVLQRYVDLIKKAGLKPAGIEPETLAIERVLGDTAERPNASIIVNISLTATQIIISYKGFVRFTRSISIGGDELTKAVQKDLGLEYVQAEEYKRAYGLDEGQVEGKVYNAVKPIFDNILAEINRSKMYYTSHNPDVIINRVILSGGTALMPGLLAYIVNKLDVEAELANPWRNVKLSEKLQTNREELIENGPLFSTAVGLALKLTQ